MVSISLPNGFTPRPAQAEFMRYMDRGGKRAVCIWPRRYGKDLTALHQTVKEAHCRGGTYYHVLPYHTQARKVLWDAYDNDGRKIVDLAIPQELRANTNQQEMKITLHCGATWQLVGGDAYNNLMGTNPVGIVFSEAAITDPRAWSFFRPILAANSGWAAFITTPRGYNWVHKLSQYAKSDPAWFYSHQTSAQTGHISAEVLAQERAQMPDEIYRQEYECDFSAANVGAIFGRYVEQAEAEGRICKLEPSFDGEIWVTSDIGYRDKSAFIFFRRMRGGFEVFDYDEGTGLDASDWIDRLRDKGYDIDVMVLPHDARAKTFQSKHTVVEQFLQSGLAKSTRVNPLRKKSDSINAGRMLFKRVRFSNCENVELLLEALRAYSFKYNDETRTFSSEPNHDYSSHAADAWQEAGACLMEIIGPDPAKQIIVPPMNMTFTLDGLHESVGQQTRELRL